MKVVAALLAAMAVVSATADIKAPDTSRIVSLSGRMASAHGCPIAPWLMVSSAHVFDTQPTDLKFPLIPYRGESPQWSGELKGVWTAWAADYAFAVPSTDFPAWYERAAEAPKAGERVWWIGYDFKNQKHAFERKLFSGEVVRDWAGTLVIDGEAIQGSSGSCVLNRQGEVVGILMGTMGLENSETVTLVVGIWGKWLTLPDEAEMRKRAQAQ